MKTLLRYAFPLLLAISVAHTAIADTITLDIEVDATQLPRKLLHARISIPVTEGRLSMWYPKWIPGIHAPRGPIENVGGMRFETPDGDPLPWQRDEEEMFLIHCDVPRGIDTVNLSIDYICSQPTVNSRGVDSYGNSLLGIINWNTCLLYPDGYAARDIEIRLTLKLPPKWRYATSLKAASEGDTLRFEPATLEQIIDSPLIAGEHLRTVDLHVEGIPPVLLHLVSESPEALQIGEELEAIYGRMATEAGKMFGGAHFDTYHLLVVLSDDTPKLGLEHLRSSLNGVGERDLQDPKEMQGWVGYLIPHEFVHSWSGKYRRPEGMATPDFHTPKHTKGLWFYEGLTQYLGEVLAVRSGVFKFDRYKERLALTVGSLMHQQGRQWRPLKDTAVDAGHLRGGSRSWGNLRRGQDYYSEGMLIWLEADAIIRAHSDGKRSLDDFCRLFMGPDLPKVEVNPFGMEEIIQTLSGLADHDWAAFFHTRLEETLDELPLDLIGKLGYRLQYSAERSVYLKDSEKQRKFVSAMHSLGIAVGEDGIILGSIVPGMPAEKAGLAPRMKVVGVNGRKFSMDRLRDAVADSVARRSVEFLLLDGDVFRTIEVPYADGPKYLEFVRDDGKPDFLSAIFQSDETKKGLEDAP